MFASFGVGFLAVLLGTEMLIYSQLGEIILSWNQKKYFFFFFFWLNCVAVRISIPVPGIKPMLPAVEA